jgi:hypothetical protein
MTSNPKATIVVPTIREGSIAQFLQLWGEDFSGHRVIVVEDNPNRTFSLPDWVEHYCWLDIEERLGADSWIIPRRTDCVRSFGYLLAHQGDSDIIVTLDDDCYPEAGYRPSYLGAIDAAMTRTWPHDRWWNTLSSQVHPRGFPYDVRGSRVPTRVHHGLWSNVPDFDARTQAELPDYRAQRATNVRRVPSGRFFPMCGMNLAFHRDVVPAMYFLLMGKRADETPWPYDRFGDIWCGIFLKKIADHMEFAMSSGAPSVHHARASNVELNLRKETPGYPINEVLWRKVDSLSLTATSVAACYSQIAEGLDMDGDYWETLRRAMLIWADLFKDR